MSLISAMEVAAAEVSGETLANIEYMEVTFAETSDITTNQMAADDDDDEEIEYGSAFKPSHSNFPANKTNQNVKPHLPQSSNIASFSTPTKVTAAVTQPLAQPVADAFGIAYKSMKVPMQSKHPIKVERREEEEEEEEDDEFELASFTIGGGAAVNDDDFQELPIAPLQHEVEGLLSFVKKAREHYMMVEEGGGEVAVPEIATVKEEEPKGLDLIVSAKKAFEELREVYGREGPTSEQACLGVSTLAEPVILSPPSPEVSSSSVPSGLSLSTPLAKLTIQEDDEEDAIAKEIEEEEMERRQVQEKQNSVFALQSEWNSLPKELPSKKALGKEEDTAGSVAWGEKVKSQEVMDYFIRKFDGPEGDVSPQQEKKKEGIIFAFSLRANVRATLDSLLQREKQVLLRLCKESYNPQDPLHFALIRRVYSLLTKERSCGGTIGSHWEVMGFQGSDPSTDLNRSMGVLSLLQTLRFAENLNKDRLCEKAFISSRHEENHWPFMLVSISFSRQVIEGLEVPEIIGECSKRKSVFDTAQALYGSLFYDFLRRLEAKPEVHHATHLNDLKESCKKRGHCAKLLESYQAYLCELSKNKSQGGGGNGKGDLDEGGLADNFTSIDVAADSFKDLEGNQGASGAGGLFKSLAGRAGIKRGQYLA